MGFVLRRESQVNQTDECGGRRGRAGSAGRQMAPPPHPRRGPRAPRPLRRPTVVQANASSWPHRSGRRRKPSGPADPGSESRAGKAWRAFRGELAGGVERRGPAWAGVGRRGPGWAAGAEAAGRPLRPLTNGRAGPAPFDVEPGGRAGGRRAGAQDTIPTRRTASPERQAGS